MNKEELIGQLKRASAGGNCTLLLCDNLGESIAMIRLVLNDGDRPMVSPDELRHTCVQLVPDVPEPPGTLEIFSKASFRYAAQLAKFAGCRLLVQVITEKSSVRKWVAP